MNAILSLEFLRSHRIRLEMDKRHLEPRIYVPDASVDQTTRARRPSDASVRSHEARNPRAMASPSDSSTHSKRTCSGSDLSPPSRSWSRPYENSGCGITRGG